MQNVFFTQSPFLFYSSYWGPLSFYNVSKRGTPWPSQHKCDLLWKNIYCEEKRWYQNFWTTQIGQRGPPAFEVNTPEEGFGCLHTGFGQTHISNLLSTLNVPNIKSVTLKLREILTSLVFFAKTIRGWNSLSMILCDSETCDGFNEQYKLVIRFSYLLQQEYIWWFIFSYVYLIYLWFIYK